MHADDAPLLPDLQDAFARVFGEETDPIEVVSARALHLLPGREVVVWEGDPATFEFTYVSPAAEKVFGHPAADWRKAGFWADVILHGEDRRDAIAYCALATAQCRDHQFEYRGRRADGEVRWIYDVVSVVKGAKGVPVKLRGVMVDITDLKRAEGGFDRRAQRRYPELSPAGA
jgi:PAS domain S-box-containing protein